MKILNYIYEFLLGEDCDVPFEEYDCECVSYESEPVILRVVTSNDAA
ncbi:MAG: hypothetical protein J6R20_01925 [Clostridia bacterium]|nr:hypothetical protein [Clostridia bacterium]